MLRVGSVLGGLSPRTRAMLLFALAAVVALSLPRWPPFSANFRITQLQVAASLTIIVLGLNLLTGYSGQISLGHSGFVLFGAYVAGILLEKGFFGHSVHPALAMLAAAAASGTLGLVVGVPALRLSGPYLAIVTLGFALAVPVMLKWSKVFDLTGGSQGIVISQPRPPGVFDDLMSTAEWRYVLIVVPALVLALLAWNITRSRFGRALVAIRDNELAAGQMGINVALHKTMAFGISAMYAGIGGALFVYASLGVVTPEAFGVIDSIGYLTAIVVGGLATIVGSALGALFLAYQGEIVRFLLGDSWNFGVVSIPSPFRWVDRPESLRWAVYGSILILIILVAPRGFAGIGGQILRWRPWHELTRARQAGGFAEYIRDRLVDPASRRLQQMRRARSHSGDGLSVHRSSDDE